MALTEFTIRHDWRAGDRELVMDLHRRGYLNHDPRFSPAHIDAMTESVGRMLDEVDLASVSDHRVWFAELGGKTVGCTALLRRGDRGQLRWVITLPEARGRGLGRRFMELAVAHAKALDLSDIYLLTVDGLTAARTLYSAFGFVTIREETAPMWFGSGTEIEMVKPLRGQSLDEFQTVQGPSHAS
ncbi:MAG: GNAT family N-acetyltransferase [Hyphomonadaceae bacterium]|nr:GNAT family N-acetyltransferase [Hyphomonadaceae bacterium]